MIRAYSSKYLDSAMDTLGEMLDYAVNACGFDADDYWQLFLTTGYATQFENGTPRVVCGLSGTELVLEVVEKAGLSMTMPQPREDYSYSPEYWSGWVMAYYQWRVGRSFKEVYHYLKIKDVLKLYPILHEAAEDKFVDTANSIIRSRKGPTNLQRLRKEAGLSQKELAVKSGVPLRTLQQYETGARDINKATAVAVVGLAAALNCRERELLEYEFTDAELEEVDERE